jgi:nucleotide-binding universal stress UspA family protein
MYRYKRLLVGISLKAQDGTAIRYASMISRLAKSEKIIFLHVADTSEIDEDICEIYPELRQSCDSATTQKIEDVVKEYYDSHPETQLVCEAVNGSPLVELLRKTKEEDVDLIIMRKRAGDKTSGNLSTKLAHRAPCSVLFVPEGVKAWYTNILVPIDFSENSVDAMEVAIGFAQASGINEIQCLNIYNVPSGYYKTGKTYEQFAEIMKGHSERHYQEFIKKIDLKGISVAPTFRLEEKDYRGIWKELIEKRDVHLLIMGAKGRRAGAGILLGSVTEHLIKTTTVPLLAVKRKSEGLGLFDAFMKL